MGFVAATVAAPFIIGALADAGDFPSSAYDPRTFLIGVLLGAVATAGLAWALEGTVRRGLMAVQGIVGFCIAGVLLVAHRDQGLVNLPLAGATVGVALALGAPGGIPLGALVGASTFTMAAMFAGAGAWHLALGVLGAVLGIGACGAALGATVGWCEELDRRGRSWGPFLGPVGVAVVLAVLVPAQIATAVVVQRLDPPALCFDTRPVPGPVVEVADFDGDGDLDALQRGDGGVSLLRNAGGTLSPEPNVPGVRAGTLVIGDADADGDIDLAALVSEPGRGPGRVGVLVAWNDGRGVFAPGLRAPLDGNQPFTLTMADLDGDRAADLVVSGQDGPTVLWSRAGRLERGPRLPSWRYTTVADVDGDGRSDILSFDGYGGVGVHRITGPAHVESTNVLFAEYLTDVAVGDLDGDGDGDLIAGGISKVVLMTNDGAGHFSPVQTLSGGRDNWPVTAGDLDGDGDLDVLAVDGPSGEDVTGDVWAWENQGAGRWSDAGRIGSTGGNAVAADLTGDGWADVVTGSSLLLARPC